jgi:large subunit ribosomal protein L5
MSNIPRLKKKYLDDIISNLKDKFDYKNKLQVPKLTKIVVNMGLGKAVQDAKIIDEAVKELADITGQKPVITKSKLSVSNFKLREGVNIGCKVTLRANKMYEFFDRLINIALPRVRDFRGVLRRSFDGQGNYTLGVKDFTIFPEINSDKVRVVKGMDITFVTTAKNKEEAFELLNEFGMPFRKV